MSEKTWTRKDLSELNTEGLSHNEEAIFAAGFERGRAEGHQRLIRCWTDVVRNIISDLEEGRIFLEDIDPDLRQRLRGCLLTSISRRLSSSPLPSSRTSTKEAE